MSHSRATRQAAADEQRQAAQRLEELFSGCQAELLGMLYYLLGNAEDARDAFQETFVKCWRRCQDLAEIVNLRAWVFRVALNAGRDMRATAWRRRRRPLDGKELRLAAHEEGPEESVLHREQLALVRQALLQLRPEEQEVFLLRQNGQMTYDQIAESMNIPVGTAKTRMRLAISKLHGCLEEGRRKDEG